MKEIIKINDKVRFKCEFDKETKIGVKGLNENSNISNNDKTKLDDKDGIKSKFLNKSNSNHEIKNEKRHKKIDNVINNEMNSRIRSLSNCLKNNKQSSPVKINFFPFRYYITTIIYFINLLFILSSSTENRGRRHSNNKNKDILDECNQPNLHTTDIFLNQSELNNINNINNINTFNVLNTVSHSLSKKKKEKDAEYDLKYELINEKYNKYMGNYIENINTLNTLN